MAHIVCQAAVRQATDDPQSDELELLWSEGAGFFEPYRLRHTPLKDFNLAVEAARKALFEVVKLSKDGMTDSLPNACLELARAGYELYETLFPPKAGQIQDPNEVRRWLEDLRDQRLVESLEVLLAEKGATRKPSTPRAVPWNVLYDKRPEPDLFLAPGEHPTVWQPFWGFATTWPWAARLILCGACRSKTRNCTWSLWWIRRSCQWTSGRSCKPLPSSRVTLSSVPTRS
jgi:hypothetical protein